MRQEVSILNLISYCLMKWRIVFCGAMIGMILLAGYSGLKLVKTNRIPVTPSDEVYQQELEEYAKEAEFYDQQIAILQRTLEETKDYISNSPLMNIDPYNEYMYVINMAIVVDEGVAADVSVDYNNLPDNYVLNKIQYLYMSVWNICDKAAIPGLDELEMEDKYLDELIHVNSSGGGLLVISAIGNSNEESQAMAEAVYKYLREKKEEFTEFSYAHEIQVISQASVSKIDESLNITQADKLNSIKAVEESIEELEDQKASLVIPKQTQKLSRTTMVKSVIRYAVVGFVIGMIAACGLLIVKCIVSGVVVVSSEIGKICNAAFVGSVIGKKTLLEKAANRLSGERVWKSEEDSYEYITSRLSSKQVEKGILLISTLSDQRTETVMNHIGSLLKDKGLNVVIGADVLRSVQASEAVRKDCRIIVVERAAKSTLPMILELNKYCAENNKEVEGFIIVQ